MLKNLTTIFSKSIVFLMFCIYASGITKVLANDFSSVPDPTLPSYGGSWQQFGSKIIDTLLEIAGIVFIGVLLIGAIVYITSGETGGEKSTEIGKKAMFSAIIGLVIVILSWSFIKFIAGLW